MKRLIPFFAAISLIFMILLGTAGVYMVKRYMPTKEMADINALYGTDDDHTAVIFNYELQEVKGIYENGQTYLPLTWINENINQRFYWDSTEKLLVYALPEQIVYADADTKGSNGTPLLFVRDGEVYLTLGLVANYTDMQIQVYDSGEAKRVLVTGWGKRNTAVLKRDGKVREKGGVKSPIVTTSLKDSQVTVLETLEKWSRVVTADGHIGYIENKCLHEISEEVFESEKEAVVYSNNCLDEKIVLVWHQVTSLDKNRQLEELIEKTEGVNVVSPTWYALTDNDGGYTSLASRAYVDQAHEMGLQVWALVNNFSADVQSEVLLSKTSTRRKLINSLMEEVEKYDLDGLNMDFEGLKKEAGVHYIQFLRELSVSCREKGIVLSVDNYVPTADTEFYNREEQGIIADYVIVMGYDEHYAGGEPGSVASLDFVRRGIERTLEVVPKEKLINAVPFYTRIWTEDLSGVKSEAVGIRSAKNWIDENDVELYWQQELGQYYGEYSDSDTDELSYIWLEDEDSLSLKMELIKANDLAGVACWKLGLEDEDVWSVIGWE